MPRGRRHGTVVLMHLHAQCCTTRRTAPHDTTSRRHLSFAENESAMPLRKSDEQSPRSGYRAGAVLSRPPRTALPGGLAQAVLEGLLPEFKLEYPCHSPTEQRWFLLRVTPLPGAPGAGGAPGGAVVAHLDITEHKLAEEERALLLAREQAARAEAEAVSGQLQQLAAVTDTTLAHLALAELLPDLSDRIRQVMAVDNVSVLLLTEDGPELTARSARGVLANLHVRFS